MSETGPVSSIDKPDRTPVQEEKYWTLGRVVVAVLMSVTAFGVVAVVQWDEIERIAQGGDDAAYLGGPGHPGHPARGQGIESLFDFSDLQIERNLILSGGVGKDGIRSLTDPETTPAHEAAFMFDDDRVVGVTVNGESRAYPIKVLSRHECYNDALGGVPIAVIFCPLCDSVSVVDRRLGEQTFEFGISGLLSNSNVLLYDRTDNALWSQAGLIAISGPNAGESLTHLNGWEITAFADWRGRYPGSTVAALETGHDLPERYHSVAYASYFELGRVMFPVEQTDDRFAAMHPVVGVRLGDQARAYPVDRVAGAEGGRVEDVFGESRVILETTRSGDVRVVEVPEGAQVLHTFWFAWYAFHPETGVYSAD